MVQRIVCIKTIALLVVWNCSPLRTNLSGPVLERNCRHWELRKAKGQSSKKLMCNPKAVHDDFKSVLCPVVALHIFCLLIFTEIYYSAKMSSYKLRSFVFSMSQLKRARTACLPASPIRRASSGFRTKNSTASAICSGLVGSTNPRATRSRNFTVVRKVGEN